MMTRVTFDLDTLSYSPSGTVQLYYKFYDPLHKKDMYLPITNEEKNTAKAMIVKRFGISDKDITLLRLFIELSEI